MAYCSPVVINNCANIKYHIDLIGTLMDGVTKGAIRNMRKELLDLSADSGQAIEVLTKARYDIVSAGFSSAAESALVLNQSVKLATASATTAAAAADILTTALNAYGLEADQTTRVSDVLFNTVKLGKTTMTELAASLGTVLPTARAAGVSIEEVGSAMATMTAAGLDTAIATTSLNGVISAMAAPTDDAKKALKELGIETTDQTGNMLNLLDVIQQFEGLSLEEVSKLIPDRRAARGLLAMANNVDVLDTALQSMGRSAGVTEEKFGEMSETLGVKLDKAIATAKVAMIEFGDTVAPIAETLVTTFTDVLSAVTDFIRLTQEAGNAELRIGEIVAERARVEEQLVGVVERQAGKRKENTRLVRKEVELRAALLALETEEQKLIDMLVERMQLGAETREEQVETETQITGQLQRQAELVQLITVNTFTHHSKSAAIRATIEKEENRLHKARISKIKSAARARDQATIRSAQIIEDTGRRAFGTFERTGKLSMTAFVDFAEQELRRLAANAFFTILTNIITGGGGSIFAGIFGRSMGGPVVGYQDGGVVGGFGTGDRVPAFLQPGEGVITRNMMENLLLRRGGGGGDGLTVNFNTPGPMTPEQEVQAARWLERVLDEKDRSF